MVSTRHARSSPDAGRQALPHSKIAKAVTVTSTLHGVCARRHLARRVRNEPKREIKAVLRDKLERQPTHAWGWNSLMLMGGNLAGQVDVCNPKCTRDSWTRYAAQLLPAYCDAAVLDLVDANAALIVKRLEFLLEEQTRRRYSNSRPSIMADVNVLNFACVTSFQGI